MTKFINHLLVFMFLTFLTAYYLSLTTAFGASWPLHRGNIERTGAIAEHAKPKLTPRWNYQIQGEIVSSPVVYKGIVYFGGRDGSVWALDAFTGQVVWQYSTSGWVDATPCVSSGSVFVPSRDKNVYAFNRRTGELLWQTYTGSTDLSSPVVYNGRLYFVSGNPERKIYIIDPSNGNITNYYQVSQFGFSSPAVKNNLLFFGTNDGLLNCIDLTNGQLKWSKSTKGGISYSCMAAGDNGVYAVSDGDERKLFKLDLNTGNTIWYSTELDNQTASASSVALSEDKVYVVSTYVEGVYPSQERKLRLFAFPQTGTSPVDYSTSTVIGNAHPSGIVSSPCVADNTIYVGSGDGRIYCFDSLGKFIEPGTGTLTDSPTGYYLSYAQSPSTGIVSSPCVANGWVYVTTFDGNIWAFQADEAANISYPDNGDSFANGTYVQGTVADIGLIGYKIEYGAGANPSSWIEVSTGTTEVIADNIGYWNTKGLVDGLYTLRLTELNDSSKKAANKVYVDNSPGYPSNLIVTDTPFDGGGSLTLAWMKSGDDGAGNNDVTGYKIYKSTFAAGFSLAGQTGKGITSYVDSNCPSQTTYYYVIAAFDQMSESDYSNIAAAFSVVDGVEILPETGGIVTLEFDGLITEIIVEPQSVESKVWMGIRIPSSYSDSGILKSAKSTNVVREFGVTPAGTKFLKPVIIKIPYKPADITNISRENLRIYWWDEEKSEWRIVNTSDPNTESGKVLARVPHFSLYRIMGYVPGKEELLSKDTVYTYPNPAKGDSVYFKYYLGDKADIFLDVYNVAGELIAHIEKSGNPAGIVSEIQWNISNIASGAYVYRLEAKSASKTKSVKKKMAIIH